MFLQQLQQQGKPQTEHGATVIEFQESLTLKRLRGVNRLSIYGFWFLTGVAIANTSRLIPYGWVVYCASVFAVAAYLLLVPSDEEQSTGNRRLAGIAIFLSCVAFWDVAIVAAVLPVHIIRWIVPLWLIGVLVLLSLVLFVILIAIIS